MRIRRHRTEFERFGRVVNRIDDVLEGRQVSERGDAAKATNAAHRFAKGVKRATLVGPTAQSGGDIGRFGRHPDSAADREHWCDHRPARKRRGQRIEFGNSRGCAIVLGFAPGTRGVHEDLHIVNRGDDGRAKLWRPLQAPVAEAPSQTFETGRNLRDAVHARHGGAASEGARVSRKYVKVRQVAGRLGERTVELLGVLARFENEEIQQPLSHATQKLVFRRARGQVGYQPAPPRAPARAESMAARMARTAAAIPT